MTEPEAFIPEAVPLLLPLNHIAISFGVPIEINGHPSPNRATEAKRSTKPVTKKRISAEIDTTKEPRSRDLKTPNRSIIIPSGWAENM
jgi:hypothetical protein